MADGVKFIWGLLNGIFQQEMKDVTKCLKEAKEIEQNVQKAIASFQSSDFDGMRKGLDSMGQAVY